MILSSAFRKAILSHFRISLRIKFRSRLAKKQKMLYSHFQLTENSRFLQIKGKGEF